MRAAPEPAQARLVTAGSAAAPLTAPTHSSASAPSVAAGDAAAPARAAAPPAAHAHLGALTSAPALAPLLRLGEASAAVASAERAAGRDSARQARAVRALEAAVDVPAALWAFWQARGLRAPRYLLESALRRAASRMYAHVAAPGDAEDIDPPAAFADDWRGLARAFASANPPAPRLQQQYERDEAALPARPAGGLAFASPAGAFRVHLLTCARCREAEARGTPDPSCEAHVLAAMLGGLSIVAGPAGYPMLRPVGPPDRPSRGAVTAADAAALASDITEQVRLGILRPLSPSEASDPATCAEVAGMHVVYKAAREFPAELGAAGADFNPGAIINHAVASGRAEAARYLRLAAGTTPSSPNGCNLLAGAFNVALAPGRSAAGKRRPVLHLNSTCNLWSPKIGTSYPTPAELVGGAGPASAGLVIDATRAYQSIRQAPRTAAHKVCQDPATGSLYATTGGAFGSNQDGAAYCALSALLKEGIRGASYEGGGEGELAQGTDSDAARWPASLRELVARRPRRVTEAQLAGNVTVTGVVDDIGVVADADRIACFRDWARTLAPMVGYTEHVAKTQMGPHIVYGGMRCDLAHPDGPSATLRPAKLHATYADLALVASLAQAALARGAGAWVPTAWLASVMGRLEWATQCDSGLLLRRGGLRVSLVRAQQLGHSFVNVGMGPTGRAACPAGAAAAGIVQRALDGHARAARFFSVDDTGAFSVSLTAAPHGVEGAQAVVTPSAHVRGFAGDASLAHGTVAVGAIVEDGSGAREALWSATAADPTDSSGSAEASLFVALARERFATTWKDKTVIGVTDNRPLPRHHARARHLRDAHVGAHRRGFPPRRCPRRDAPRALGATHRAHLLRRPLPPQARRRRARLGEGGGPPPHRPLSALLRGPRAASAPRRPRGLPGPPRRRRSVEARPQSAAHRLPRRRRSRRSTGAPRRRLA